MGKYTEHLLRQGILGDPVMVPQSRLRRPADVERGIYVRLGPRHDRAQLVPVIHVREIEVFHRCARDDQPVKPFVAHVVKGAVEGGHVCFGGVGGGVGRGLEQGQLDL